MHRSGYQMLPKCLSSFPRSLSLLPRLANRCWMRFCLESLQTYFWMGNFFVFLFSSFFHSMFLFFFFLLFFLKWQHNHTNGLQPLSSGHWVPSPMLSQSTWWLFFSSLLAKRNLSVIIIKCLFKYHIFCT